MSTKSKLTVFRSFQPATENSRVLRVPASHVVTLRKCLRHISVLKPSNLWHVLQHWRSIFDPNPGKIPHELSTRLWKRTGHPKTPQIVPCCKPPGVSHLLRISRATLWKLLPSHQFVPFPCQVFTCQLARMICSKDWCSASVSLGLMIVTKSIAKSHLTESDYYKIKCLLFHCLVYTYSSSACRYSHSKNMALKRSFWILVFYTLVHIQRPYVCLVCLLCQVHPIISSKAVAQKVAEAGKRQRFHLISRDSACGTSATHVTRFQLSRGCWKSLRYFVVPKWMFTYKQF